jgi:hypothetical protein
VTLKKVILLSLVLFGCLITIGLLAQQAPSEAPAGFDTLTLQTQNAGSESSSNGIAEPPGDSFVRDQQIFEKREDAALGLRFCGEHGCRSAAGSSSGGRFRRSKFVQPR